LAQSDYGREERQFSVGSLWVAAISSSSMPRETLKRIDILRHELKALRYILDRYHGGQLPAELVPPREDFQSEQGRVIYDVILGAPSRGAAERAISQLELEDVDIESFLRLGGEHYHTYPALVRERAAAIRKGALKVESA
jgi:hypothetical protein